MAIKLMLHKKAVIISSPNAYRMNSDLVAVALGIELGKYGYDVLQLTRDARPPGGLDKGSLLFFLQLGVPDIWECEPGIKVVLNFHPTAPDGRYGRHAQQSFQAIKEGVEQGSVDWIFDYNPQTTRWMRNEGLPAIFCPIGYHEVFDNFHIDQGDSHGVYFIGRAKGSRAKIVKACNAMTITDVWGEDRNTWTRAGGIHLSLASYNKFRTCLTLRLIVLLASNQCAIVHEETDWCPLEHGRHCLIGPAEEIPDLVKYLQEFESVRQMLAQQSYEFVKSSHRFETALRVALHEAEIERMK